MNIAVMVTGLHHSAFGGVQSAQCKCQNQCKMQLEKIKLRQEKKNINCWWLFIRPSFSASLESCLSRESGLLRPAPLGLSLSIHPAYPGYSTGPSPNRTQLENLTREMPRSHSQQLIEPALCWLYS